MMYNIDEEEKIPQQTPDGHQLYKGRQCGTMNIIIYTKYNDENIGGNVLLCHIKKGLEVFRIRLHQIMNHIDKKIKEMK